MVEAVIGALAGILLGLATGYALWATALSRSRQAHTAALATHAQASVALATREAELAAERTRADSLATVRHERDGLARELAALTAGSAAREVALGAREADLRQQFDSLAQAALQGAQARFEALSAAALAQHRAAADTGLKELLTPVADTLKRYEEGLKGIETAREQAYGGIAAQIEAMRLETVETRGETRKLANVLRASPKARGRWGEMALRNVLERAGLSEHCDFAREVSVSGEDGRLRPDVIVRLPGGRQLIVDAKCAFNAYEDAANAPDEDTRAAHLKAHAQSMRRHAEQLGRKAYWDQFDDAPDYVVMFVSGEQFLSAAMEADALLWEDAFEKRVLMAGPMHLVGIARTVAAVWRQERVQREAAEIGAAARELYERLATMGEHVRKLGAGLKSSVDNYNAFVGSLETKVIPKARAIRAMNIEPPKSEIPDLAPLEAIPRAVTREELLPRLEIAAE